MQNADNHPEYGELLIEHQIESPDIVREFLKAAESVNRLPEEPPLEEEIHTDALNQLFKPPGENTGTEIKTQIWGMTALINPERILLYESDEPRKS